MKSLTNEGIIVTLSISKWTGRRFDRKVTNEVNSIHNTVDAGRFNKVLIDKSALSDITRTYRVIRNFHYENTLPWGDNGDRILPATNYFQYSAGLKTLKDTFNEQADSFVANYDLMVDNARLSLNGMFNPNDYPLSSEIRSKFDVRMTMQPIPETSNDFRLTMVSDSIVDQISQDIEVEIASRHAQATSDLIRRVKDAVKAASVAVGRFGTKRRAQFNSSLINNIQALIDIIPSLNYTNDATIQRLRDELRSLVVDPSAIRSDETVRESYVARAKELEQMFF